MSETLADQFISALGTLEATRDVEPLTKLFSDNAELGNVLVPDKFHGPEGARDFWGKYRSTFDTLRSTFRNRIETDSLIALEWNSEGTSADGKPIRYQGVSIIEADTGKIKRFEAYFDPASLGRQMEAAAGS